jgi:hypothetical protein
MSKYVNETAAAKSLSAYVILNPKGQHVATVKAHFSNSRRCLVNVHCFKDGFQHATAGGYGYDKFSHALRGMTIDGHAMTDHCSRDKAPKPPKGRHTFPRDYKPRKGYSLANFGRVSKATGGRFYRDHWQNLACDALGVARDMEGLTDGQLAAIAMRANELEANWIASDDCEAGYSDCYREAGLDYLKALGYRVIQAI